MRYPTAERDPAAERLHDQEGVEEAPMRGVRGESLAGSPQNVIGQADHLGLAWNFYFFAALNLAGALLDVLYHPAGHPDDANGAGRPLSLRGVDRALRNPRLCAAFGIGFCILFVFIGTFTYVNFVLLRPPVSLGPMDDAGALFCRADLTTQRSGRRNCHSTWAIPP